MKFQNQAHLCLAIYHFETHIMLSLFFKVASLMNTYNFCELVKFEEKNLVQNTN